jgi:hypothetical protein
MNNNQCGRSLIRPLRLNIASLLLCCAITAPCSAAQYEIQVYSDDLAKAEESEAEFTGSFAKPRASQDGPRGRVTEGLAQFSYGVAAGWAVGLELPFAHYQGSLKSEGAAAEVQYVSASDEAGWYYGGRADYGREKSVYEDDSGQAMEVNLIAGYHWDRWNAVINPSFEIPVGGGGRQTLFQPSARVVASVWNSQEIGLEYYGNWGPVRALNRSSNRDEMLYLTWGAKRKVGQIQLGVGEPMRSGEATQDKWVVKLDIGMDFD